MISWLGLSLTTIFPLQASTTPWFNDLNAAVPADKHEVCAQITQLNRESHSTGIGDLEE